jgi:hypothetical protein
MMTMFLKKQGTMINPSKITKFALYDEICIYNYPQFSAEVCSLFQISNNLSNNNLSFL